MRLAPGIVYALLAAVLFGASTPLAKLLLGAVPPALLAGLLYIGAGAGLGTFRLLRPGAGGNEAPLGRADLPWLAGSVLAGGVAGPLLLMLGLARIDAAAAALLLNLEAVFTLAIAWLALGEGTDRRIVLGAGAILAGAGLLSWSGGPLAGPGWGSLAIAGACLAWAIDNNLTRRLAAADPVALTIVKGLVAGSVNLLIGLLAGAAWPGLAVIAAALAVGLAGYGVSLVLFILALRHLGTARTGAYFSTAPFIGAFLAVLLLGEPATPLLAAAGALMAIGLWLHLSERHAHGHVHERLSHAHRHVHDPHHRHAH